MSDLFQDGPAEDICYTNIRDNAGHRVWSETLWNKFEPLADDDFVEEIKKSFHQRWWEMFLGAFCVERDLVTFSKKPGPDFGIKFGDQTIWIEATAPTRGAEEKPDTVPPLAMGVGSKVPVEKILLRIISSIDEKCRQYERWIEQGVIPSTDQFIIALNWRTAGDYRGDAKPPYLLRAAYKLGNQYVSIDRNDRNNTKSGYSGSSEIKKENGSLVEHGYFQIEKYRFISGLIFSDIDAASPPNQHGPFTFAPNPFAGNPIPAEFKLGGKIHGFSQNDDGSFIIDIEGKSWA